MRILWVKMGGLWPATTGGRVRSLNTIAELARRHQVHVFSLHWLSERLARRRHAYMPPLRGGPRAARPTCFRLLSTGAIYGFTS